MKIWKVDIPNSSIKTHAYISLRELVTHLKSSLMTIIMWYVGQISQQKWHAYVSMQNKYCFRD